MICMNTLLVRVFCASPASYYGKAASSPDENEIFKKHVHFGVYKIIAAVAHDFLEFSHFLKSL